MTATVNDIIQIMEQIAPAELAEAWDNVGLQVGSRSWPVKHVWVALDPTPEIVAAACKQGVDLLVTHHPLIFKPLASLDFSTPEGGIIEMAARERLAVFSAHTNLDSAKGGLNDELATRIGLKSLQILANPKQTPSYKLVVYVPAEHEQQVLEAIWEIQAGRIGEYTCCTFRQPGTGSFRPGDRAQPLIGRAGQLNQTPEIRVELNVSPKRLEAVVAHIRRAHPYETMAYDLYPLRGADSGQGLGRVGELITATDLQTLAADIKRRLGLQTIKWAGAPDMPVRQVAVCSGSGSSLLGDFFSSGAEVYLSGDLRYHDAMAVAQAGCGLIDVGHFASENLIVNPLAKRLKSASSERGMDLSVEACTLQRDVFQYMSD